jgi:hypothetical protein
MIHRLGRKPRTFRPGVPHMSALRMARPALLPVPERIDYTPPGPLGVMLNDKLGDCTAAGCYHARQVWTSNVIGAAETEPDTAVLSWYIENTGYDPVTGMNDTGAVEQDVLTKWLRTGLPLGNGERQRLLGFVEIDPRNFRDIRRAIWECGLVYIGFEVPSDIPEAPGAVWDNCAGPIDGGHCVILTGFDPTGFHVISWGARYIMTELFATRYIDEAYALISEDWITTTGQTLLGMTTEELDFQMRHVR